VIDDVSDILITEEELQAEVTELGRAISSDYAGKDILLVCILKGGFIFLADLVRAITIPVEIDFMHVSSYGRSRQSSGVVRIIQLVNTCIQDRHVLVVEDIVDTGGTVRYTVEDLMARKAASVRTCCLLRKARELESAVHLDYVGFEVPDRFVVGYGLDYAERYRNLPFVGVLPQGKHG
jgi:hypoxanthine phosphoribosyltransferase